MRTSIVEIVGADGAGKGSDGWFDLTHSVVSYDRRARAECPGRGGAYARGGQGTERCACARDRRSGNRGKRTFARDIGRASR